MESVLGTSNDVYKVWSFTFFCMASPQLITSSINSLFNFLHNLYRNRDGMVVGEGGYFTKF